MSKKAKTSHRWQRRKKTDVITKAIRMVCIYHRRPMLQEKMLRIAIEYITSKLTVSALKRLQKNEADPAFVKAMVLATPFVT